MHVLYVSQEILCSGAQNNALENNEHGVKPKAAANETLKHVVEK